MTKRTIKQEDFNRYGRWHSVYYATGFRVEVSWMLIFMWLLEKLIGKKVIIQL